MPGVSRKERIGLCNADRYEHPHASQQRGQGCAAVVCRGRTDILNAATNCPKVAEISGCDLGIPGKPDDYSKNNKCDERAGLGKGKAILNELAELEAARIHKRQKDDHDNAEQLCGR